MELKNRSFRVTDETADRLKEQAAATGHSMYVVLCAAVDAFDPVNNEDHAEYLKQTQLKFDAGDVVKMIDNMPADMRAQIMKKLKSK